MNVIVVARLWLMEREMVSFAFVVINMDRDTKRLERVTQKFASLNLPFIRFPAVNGSDVPAFLKSKFFEEDGSSSVTLSPGEIGCFSSHLSVCKTFVEGGFGSDFIVILEDDFLISDDIYEIITSSIDGAPDGWDIIKLFGDIKRPAKLVKWIYDKHMIVMYSRVPAGTVAQIVSLSGAKKLLGINKITKAIDTEISQPWVHGLNVYGVYPPPVDTYRDDSTIISMGRGYNGRGIFGKEIDLVNNIFKRSKMAVMQFGLFGYLRILYLRIVNLYSNEKIKIFE